ncbi:hypothetical protein GOV08_02735 [Candidatus Woesearchaeota archaeon]|nr:hypothetical protein [Candidatus Woesearchaeota archaeon]
MLVEIFIYILVFIAGVIAGRIITAVQYGSEFQRVVDKLHKKHYSKRDKKKKS